MGNERVILCGPVPQGNLPARDSDPLRLRLWEPGRNVHLAVEDVRRAMFGDVPAPFLDLIDLAAFVYAADQAVPRGSPEDWGFGAGWRRRLFFRVAVRDPALWNSPRVAGRLVSALSFLSEDEYHFQFEPLRS